MFLATANTGMIAQDAMQTARDVRKAMIGAQNFSTWISAQSDPDMLGLLNPFTQGDIDKMRSMAADLSALGSIYRGQPPPSTYVLPYNFAASSAQIIGSVTS